MTGPVNEEPVTGVVQKVVIAVVETVALVNENEVGIDENVIDVTEVETAIAVVENRRDEVADEVVAGVKIVAAGAVEEEVAAEIIDDRDTEVVMIRIERVAVLNATDHPVNVR